MPDRKLRSRIPYNAAKSSLSRAGRLIEVRSEETRFSLDSRIRCAAQYLTFDYGVFARTALREGDTGGGGRRTLRKPWRKLIFPWVPRNSPALRRRLARPGRPSRSRNTAVARPREQYRGRVFCAITRKYGYTRLESELAHSINGYCRRGAARRYAAGRLVASHNAPRRARAPISRDFSCRGPPYRT